MAATTTLYGSSRFASSSSSTLPRWSYDVFLSFRGEDTRKNFTDHLYAALVQAGIHTFIDDDELPRGHDISLALLKSIEESRISIVVFSTNYASSRWCLDELVKIIECKNTLGQLVLPIFYHVDPSNVRNKTGCFGEAFGRHEKIYVDEMERVEVRRAALTEAANLAGWDIPNIANWYEAKLIRKVVEEVSCKLKRTLLNVAKHPVGIESRVVHINLLLSIASDDVRMIGIYGLGGIGKTTIAKAVYNHIFLQFEGCCFLANVRECARQSNGLARLQERLLFALLGTKNLKIDSVDRGIILMKERLHSKKVLIVLDDVDHSSQLDTLAGNHDWFGPGSRIIITTRDEHLLKGLKVDERYMAKELNDEESLQLFSLHAMGETNPLENYADLGNGIVRYASGLPLALEVLGSHLFDVNMVLWKSAFDELQQIPHDDIQKKLKISFDALGNGKFKDIFLDIACFFIGMDKDCAITILNACDLCAEYGIYMLISRCLLKINEQNKLTMHDLLRDMGREIVRQESPKELGKRSRLWFHGDVLNVLGKNKGTEKIEGVILTGLPMLNMIQWSNKAFAGMHKLRLLQINHVHLSGNFEHLFEELRWLCWHNCPLEYLPSNFHPEKLVVLNMQFSRFKTLRIDGKHFRSLKFLNLSNSKCLTKSPIFCALPMLEELLLESCTGLMELHESIGLLDKLVHLNLKDCMNLRYLPGIICKLKSVKRLNLTGCAKLEEFPEHLGCMESLTELLTDGTAIKQLPFSIGLLKNLRSLSLKGCNRQLTTKSWFSLISSWVLPRKNPDSIRLLPSSVSGLCSLTELDLRDCNLSEEDFPINFGSLSSLRALDLGGNDFCILPYGFSHLSKLENLNLNNCRSLQSISGLPPNLLVVNAEFCASLKKISSPSIGLLDKLVHLNLKDCMNLRYLPGIICKLKSVKRLNLTGCAKLEEFPEHLGCMESLTELLTDGTAIKQLPFSIGLLKNLRSLSLKGCNRQLTTKSWFSLISSWVLPRKNPDSIRLLPSSVSGLCSLTELDLRDCNLSEEDFPINFGSLSSLRALDLGGNDFCILPYGFSHLSKLENLNLNNCRSLQSISGLPPNLLVVNAEFCASLKKISSPSIGLLDKLVYLNLEGCMNLRYFLGSICKLKSLEHLNISGCAKLKGFLKHGGHVESLTVLIVRTGLKKLPPLSVGLLTNLRSLLWNRCCKQFTTKLRFSLISSQVLLQKIPNSIRFLPTYISDLCFLTKLDLSDRNLSEGDFPADLRSLSSLRVLYLGGNNFHSLPCGFSHLSKLEHLGLDNCTSLQSISGLPPNLLVVQAHGCASLEKILGLSKLKNLVMMLSKDRIQHSLSNHNNDGMEESHCFEGARIIPLDRPNNLHESFRSISLSGATISQKKSLKCVKSNFILDVTFIIPKGKDSLLSRLYEVENTLEVFGIHHGFISGSSRRSHHHGQQFLHRWLQRLFQL